MLGLRSMKIGFWYNEIRRRAGIEETRAEKVDRRVLRWFGHVERMDEGAGQERSRQLKWKVIR